MKRDEIFKSKYLKHADLKGKSVVVTIASAPLETLKNGDKEQDKTVLHFKGKTKMLPLKWSTGTRPLPSAVKTPTCGRVSALSFIPPRR